LSPSLKTWLVRVGVLAVLAGGIGGFWRYRAAHKPPDFHFETVKVDRGRIVAKVTATGTLSALVTVQVGSQVSGRLQEIKVDFNSPVKKGQLIAKIDPQLFQAALEQARANFLAAQSNVAKARVQALEADRQYERSKALAERQLVAPADLQTAEANAGVAHAQIDAASGALAQAKASLHQAQVNLAYTTIISPIDGIVVSRNVDVGQTVAASFQAPVLFVLAEDLRTMQVDTSVAEADVGRLKPGMPASFAVDAYPGKRFQGTIRQIRNAPQTVQNIVTYDAVIDVANPELELKPGMTANVNFVYAEKDDVLRVPSAAMRFRPAPDLMVRAGASASPAASADRPRGGGRREATNQRTVWVLRNDKPASATITVGVSDGTLAELLRGDIREGDLLVTDVSGPGAATSSAGGPGGGRPPGRLF
jgi:HlyD family secretion protein